MITQRAKPLVDNGRILSFFMAAQARAGKIPPGGKSAAWRIRQGLRHPPRAGLAFLSLGMFRFFRRTISVSRKTFWHDRLRLVLPEPVSLSIFLLGFHEPKLTRTIIDRVKPCDTFIDIGAHLGYYSTLASSLVGKAGQVHCFEPTPSTFALLSQNLRATGRANIVANNQAVFSRTCSLKFNDFGPFWSAFNSLTDARLDSKTQQSLLPTSISVQAVSLDEYVAAKAIDRVDFVKIDAESAEFEILLGMRRILRSMRPLISLEVGDASIPGVKSSRELIEFLHENGYDPFECQDGSLVKHELRDHYSYDNLLFAPR